MNPKISMQLSLGVGEVKLEPVPPRPVLPPKLVARPELDGIRQRFWRRVKKGAQNECWEWQIKCKGTRYGLFLLFGVNTSSNRVAWFLEKGPIPDGLFVLHKCDNTWCCNPSHLFLGTQSDNIKDCSAKGRLNHFKGEQASHARLTDAKVIEMRALHAKGISIYRLCRQFGVGYMTAHNAVKRKNWKHVP